ncbi:MAG: histone deacetylase [Spirochaetes bacterium]|nr:histone deacetylase [Spirochaetota bacterium]
MILYDAKKNPSFIDYGIEIPIREDKVKNIVDFLRTDQDIKKRAKNILHKTKNIKITKKDLLRVHSKEYVDILFSGEVEDVLIKVYELIDENGNYYRYDPKNAKYPLKRHFKTILRIVSGTYQSLYCAAKKGFCFFLGGGMHHGKRDYGEGFCVVNDVVIGIRKLQTKKIVKTVWIIDLDAHKGDGTASLTENNDSIITLSIHMAKGWPLDKQMYDKKGKFDPSFTSSDIDIPVESGEENQYNEKLLMGLNRLKKYKKPDLALVLSGADPYEHDELDSTKLLKLSLEQLFERDKMVFNFLTDLKIPKAYIMSGGYGVNSWKVYTQFLKWIVTEQL